MSDEGNCRTARATPGLLIIIYIISIVSVLADQWLLLYQRQVVCEALEA